MTDKNRITLRMRGPDKDEGDVRFNDFIKQLDNVRRALAVTAKSLEINPDTVYYRVVDLSHNSPATVVLEAVVQRRSDAKATDLTEAFVSNLKAIQQHSQISTDLDHQGLEVYQQLTGLFRGKRLTEFVVAQNGASVALDQTFSRNIETILGPVEYEAGQVEGYLHHINLHGNQAMFTVYPNSRLPKVQCYFPGTLREQAVEAVDKYVEVYGQVGYRANAQYPFRVRVSRIEVFEDEATLPSLMNLRGAAGTLPEGVTSESIVRGMRDEWNDTP